MRGEARLFGSSSASSYSVSTRRRSIFQSQAIKQIMRCKGSPKRAQQPSIACTASSKEEPAVIIVDHGSRREESNRQLEQFVELYRGASRRQKVVAAHMEIAKPSIADAIEQCSAAGYKRVVVAPYFLSSGRHIQQDIPALVAEALEAHPHIECSVADPIGLDSAMASLIERRVRAALLATNAES